MERRLFLAALAGVSLPALAANPNKPHGHQGIIGAWGGAPDVPSLNAADLTTLGQGKAVLKQVKQATGGRGIAVQDIHADVDTVWGRITDYAAYPRMVDNVSACSVYEKSGDLIKVKFVLSAVVMTVEYYVVHTYKPDQGYMTWTLDYTRESDLDDSVGFWYVQALDDKPGYTRVFYSVDVRLKGWVPGAIENMIAKTGLTKATAWVKRESEKAAGN